MSRHRHSHPVRLIRRACRRCRNYTSNVVAPCPSCGTRFPRVRFSAIPLWMAIAMLLAGGIAILNLAPVRLLLASQ